MKKLLKKIILSILVFLTIFISFAPYAAVKAQTWYNQGFVEWYTKVYDENMSPPTDIFGERYTAAQVQWVMWGLLAQPINFLGRENQQAITCIMKYVGQNAIDGSECIGAVKGLFDRFKDFITPTLVASADSSSLTASIFNTKNRPISGIGYISNLLAKFRLVPEANAQGFGFTALNPIQKYWTGIRNVAYSLMVLVIIVFAFMIMFRVKLSPQTVISVQSTLPKIIIALILATFSYAIAGFLIDLMYVFGGFLALMLQLAGFAGSSSGAYHTIFPENDYGFYFLVNMIGYAIFFLIGLLWSFIATTVMVSPAILAGGIISIFGILLVIWLVILSFWYTFKISWILIKTLISIYFSIIIAPLQIVLGAVVPQIGFGAWIKKMAVELMVFPVTGMFMFFAWRLMWTSYKINFQVFIKKNILSALIESIIDLFGGNTSWFDVIWVPSIIGFAESISGLIVLLMSFSIIIALPKVIDILKAAIMGEKFTFGTAMGEAIAPIKGIWGATGQPYVRGAQEAVGKGFASTLSGSTKTGRLSKLPQWAKDIIQKGAPQP